MAEKRLIIYEVPGECKYLSVTDSGYYCAACIHCDGWEKIEPSACQTCTHDKHFDGESREDVLYRIAKALYEMEPSRDKEIAFEQSMYRKSFLKKAELILESILEK